MHTVDMISFWAKTAPQRPAIIQTPTIVMSYGALAEAIEAIAARVARLVLVQPEARHARCNRFDRFGQRPIGHDYRGGLDDGGSLRRRLRPEGDHIDGVHRSPLTFGSSM